MSKTKIRSSTSYGYNKAGMIIIILVVILVAILAIYYVYDYMNSQPYNIDEKFDNDEGIDDVNKSPCNDKLTDIEYLVHMIPHHMVAIDVSYMLQKTSKNSVMQDILRNLIWMQEYEITMMNSVLQQLLPEIRLESPRINQTNAYKTINRNYITSVVSFIDPNKVGYVKAVCDPNFFNVEDHRAHIASMGHELDEIMYIKHMIPHHQVAVDMSKRLLKHTQNPFMMELCYRIIRGQEKEIVFLSDMLDNTSWLADNNSKLLQNI